MCDSPKADNVAVAIENASRTRLSVNDSKISILGNFQSSMRHPAKSLCF
jgi:rRNA processing protein Krr1/Pno1